MFNIRGWIGKHFLNYKKKNIALLALREEMDRLYGPDFAQLECKKVKIYIKHDEMYINLYVAFPDRFKDFYTNIDKFGSTRIKALQRRVRFYVKMRCYIILKQAQDLFNYYEY